MKIQLTQQIIIPKKHSYFTMLDELCFLSKNLYNACLYEIRQQYNKDKTYFNYNELNRLFSSTNNIDYRALPYTQISQQVLRQVDSQYKSFDKAIKSLKMKGKHVRLPKYKDKINGRNIAVYTNQCFKLKEGKLSLKVKSGFLIFYTDKTDIQQVRIVPKGNHIVVEIIYNKEYVIKEDNSRYASIDLGLNNLCALSSNVCQSVLYNGKPLKAINQYYNKKKGKLQSKLEKDKYTSKRISNITSKRNRKIKDYLHKVSCAIVKYMESNSLNTLFVGKNEGWKDSINLGDRNNQNFVSIPYNMLINMLEYKCNLHGIKFITLKESYTSKCSFLDNERVTKHEIYAGKRIKRGLFVSQSGIKINADINGSLNIMRLGLIQLKVKLDVLEITPENQRFVLNPVSISI